MLYYFVTERNYNPPLHFLHTKWGKPFRNSILPLSYSWAANLNSFSGGIFLFSDLEILTDKEMSNARLLAERISKQKEDFLILNDPRKALTKLEVLQNLHKAGINQYRAYSLCDYKNIKKFPVFLKGAGNHGGPASKLLYSRKEIEAHLKSVNINPQSHDFFLVEHLLTDQQMGYYTKFSYYKFGPHVFPRHVFFNKDWMIKVRDRLSPSLANFEREFMLNDPHRETILQVFEECNLEYGRVDYSLLDGKPQIWKINTNPNWALTRYTETPFKRHLHELFYSEFIPRLENMIKLFPTKESKQPFFIPQIYHNFQFIIADLKQKKKETPLNINEKIFEKISRWASSFLRKTYPVRR